MQLGQLPAQRNGAVAQPLQQRRQGLPQAVGRFVKDKGVRQPGNGLQGGVTLPLFDGQKALKQEFAGRQAAGGRAP